MVLQGWPRPGLLLMGLNASIQWDDPDRTCYDENGKEVVVREGMTREWVITEKGGDSGEPSVQR